MTKYSACTIAIFYWSGDEQDITCQLNRNQQLVPTAIQPEPEIDCLLLCCESVARMF